MTIAMPDSIYPQNLPPGYPAYLGYVDGSWPDFQAEIARFGGARVLGLAVTAADDAEGLDIEFSDATPAQAPGWAMRQLLRGISRPVLYASAATMSAVLTALTGHGVARSQVRLLSAHWTGAPHICAPPACPVPVPMDGTQWTNAYRGLNGSLIDMSMLRGDFFGTPQQPPSWEDSLLATIPVIKKGDSGQAVKNWQGLLMAHGYSLAPYGSDGNFGDLTDQRTRTFQADRHLTVDGTAGQQTWTAALTA